MKNKILALLATIGLASSVTAVEINDNLSITGFIDGSYETTDTDNVNHDSSELALDEVEINFLLNVGNVSGEIHVDSDEAAGGVELFNIEQAHFTYSFENGLSAQIGRFGSNLGFEREDPAGLYTFSRAYGDELFNTGNIDAGIYVGEGVSLSYATDSVALSVSAVNGVGEALEGVSANTNGELVNYSENNLDFEVALSFTGIENLVINAGIISRNGLESGIDLNNDDVLAASEITSATDPTIYSLSAAYTLDKLLLAGEYVNYDADIVGTSDLSAYMLLADYDINDKLGVALRYSEYETGPNAESDRLTIAPNYAITSSLGAILEYTSDEDNAGNDSDTLALELTYTF
jgi:hypothetical protein